MAIQFQLSKREFIGGCILGGYSNWKSRLVLASTVILIAVLIVLFVDESDGCCRDTLMEIVSLAIFAYFFVCFVWNPWTYRSIYKNYPLMHRNMEVGVTTEGVRITYASGENLYLWQDLYGWRQNRRYVLLFLAPSGPLIIPKRLANQGLDIEFLTSQLKQNVGKEK